MNTLKNNKHIVLGFSIIIILILLSSFALYATITKQYQTKLDGLEQSLGLKDQQLQDRLEEVDKTSKAELSKVEQKMLANFKTLETSINDKTSEVKLDLETQLEGVSTKFEEKSSELEGKISSLDVESSDFSAIIDDVLESVVSVRTNKGSGSGVFVTSDLIITNRHVLEEASSVYVVDYNGNWSNAKIIATAENVDLAALRIISEKEYSYLRMADQSDTKVGEKIIAVGNPLGLSFTVTEGIISSLNRVVDGQIYLQTDVPINPGNSGGPLINSEKKVVGINTFKLTNSEGLGFAVPSNVVQEFIDLVEENS